MEINEISPSDAFLLAFILRSKGRMKAARAIDTYTKEIAPRVAASQAMRSNKSLFIRALKALNAEITKTQVLAYWGIQ